MKTVYIQDETHRRLFQASVALDRAVQTSAEEAVRQWLHVNSLAIERANREFKQKGFKK